MKVSTMRTMRMSGFVLSLALVAAPAAGQQTVEDPAERAQALADAELRAQLNAFNYRLRDAIERSGQRLADWAGEIAPGIELAFAANPVVEATPLPDNSVVFDVRIPEILQTSMMLVLRQWPRSGTAGATPVGRGPVSGTGAVPADPMTVPPPGATERLTPNEQYSNLVREELIEAIVDGARILPIEAGQWLHVAANGVDVAITNPLYRNRSRKLILSLKGEDLAAFRSGELSRDQIRTRIVERRF
ncbi:MAG TPA: hypothetical protein VMM93_02065 [Vicinamibacterales bacterium]|nr:hypothetical protein [Vicinamibacterales bacterium]